MDLVATGISEYSMNGRERVSARCCVKRVYTLHLYSVYVCACVCTCARHLYTGIAASLGTYERSASRENARQRDRFGHGDTNYMNPRVFPGYTSRAWTAAERIITCSPITVTIRIFLRRSDRPRRGERVAHATYVRMYVKIGMHDELNARPRGPFDEPRRTARRTYVRTYVRIRRFHGKIYNPTD